MKNNMEPREALIELIESADDVSGCCDAQMVAAGIRYQEADHAARALIKATEPLPTLADDYKHRPDHLGPNLASINELDPAHTFFQRSTTGATE